ncbi:MAG: hypothetical protein ACRD1H_06870, partial [Vicinamibacterales bacterium]
RLSWRFARRRYGAPSTEPVARTPQGPIETDSVAAGATPIAPTVNPLAKSRHSTGSRPAD